MRWLAVLMSERMVLRMTARKEEDVVLGSRGNNVLRSLINNHLALFLEKKQLSSLKRRDNAFVLKHNQVLYEAMANIRGQ